MNNLPELWSTRNVSKKDKIIHARVTCGRVTWYLAEYDPETGAAYGMVSVGDGNGRLDIGWGAFNLEEAGNPDVWGMDLRWDNKWKKQTAAIVIRKELLNDSHSR
jgi:hypothetical protein